MAVNTLEFQGTRYLDGRASDPLQLGWMRGSPPPLAARIAFSDNAFEFPQVRWSFSHMRELIPTVNVRHSDGGPSVLAGNDRTEEIDALICTDTNGSVRRFEDTLFDTYTDGYLVLHRGRIVYERYLGVLGPHVPHAAHSITKSYVGTLAAALVHEGVLDDVRTVPHYLPELQHTAWGDATLRQVMDMQTGLAYSEEYTDKNASVWKYSQSVGFRPRPAGYAGPSNLCQYLLSVTKEGEHGADFSYKTINTEVLSWVMTRVTGRSLAQLLHEMLWDPLGCEDDGYLTIDVTGMPHAGGGLSATLRDMARFGEMMRCDGAYNGKQIIPAEVIRDVRMGDHSANFTTNGVKSSYRSQWWVTNDEFGAFQASGIHGQRLYIAPSAEMVIARFGSHPIAAASAGHGPISVPQMRALGRMLRS